MDDKLESAVRKNDVKALQALIKAGADVNERDRRGRTPLFWAIQNDSLAAVEVLVKAGADVTVRDNDRLSTFDWAESPEMRQLLARAWPQDHPLRLHALAAADLADEVVDAVAAGADVNARDEMGRTPLFWAIQRNSLAAAEVLVEAGTGVTVCDNDGRSTLSRLRSPEMGQLLARAWPQDHPLRLHALFKADLTDEVVDAVAAGADVDARDDDGRTPLFWAIKKNSPAAAEMLVKAGADVNARDEWGRTPLLRAIENDSLAVAEVLIKAGADVNARDEQGQTPLFWAIMKKSLAAAEVLIKAGADVTVCDNHGRSTLDRAKSPEMRQLLTRAWPQDHPLRLHALTKAELANEVADAVAAGADVNARDEDGRTPLFWALQNDSLAVVKVLIKAGADVTIRDNDGRSTLDRSQSRKMRRLLGRAWPKDHPR